jgi:dGTPase
MEWAKLLCHDRLRQTTRQPEETRTEIERDYGRVIFSTPVRRLQDKAQVFPLEPIDAVRTRLTHSLEVSSVSRGLAHSVGIALLRLKKIKQEQLYDIENVAATCGLIHDLGNPPFGHAGEEAMRDWFRKQPEKFWKFDTTTKQKYRKDFENFEGNAQTLRLVATLQLLSDRSGLNLTCATLSAGSKYTASSLQIDKNSQAKKKLGFFNSEKNIVDEVRTRTGTGGKRNPITLLVEAADDIVYSVVDLEDGIKKGVVSWIEVAKILDDYSSRIGANIIRSCVNGAETRINAATIPLGGRNRDEAISQFFRTLVIGKATDAVTHVFVENYSSIMAGEYDKELLYDPGSSVGELYQVLKGEIGFKHVYCSKETLRLELLGRNVIHYLMDTFWQADSAAKPKTFARKTYDLLSQNYRTVFENPTSHEKTLPTAYRKIMLITDYICGMTDSFALNLKCELQNGQ